MCLRVLYPSKSAGNAESIEADIVAVHGLYGRSNTWTSRNTNAFWLKDFLPHDVPNARVMSFEYNADAAFGNTTADIIDHAKSLLSSMIDKREEDDELRRPIIFIGHSLGGIVIKQSLLQATIEPRYNIISESTVGIMFLGTPHRGTDKTSYGKILATVATASLNKPSPRLVNALQVNSEALLRLTTDFRLQVPKYQVYSFYEMKPMKMLSTLVVEKHSALLEIDGEEQIPVDADHEKMCKFMDRESDVYEKLFKRVRRMMEIKDRAPLNSSSVCDVSSFNKHYHIPHHLSAIFTGREDVIQKISEGCLPSDTAEEQIKQKRFVLYGLGGSGKTQICIKFAEDFRERFWGIFWIDASSHITARQGFLEIARMCGVDEDPKVVKQWLSNTGNHWLLIIDNADDLSFDVSEFFPLGDRGSILLSTRNPYCKIHSTVGSCELGQLNMDEAVTLLLKASGTEDVADEAVRKKAIIITQTLGFLALAIVQAGAYIRRAFCSIDEYCDVYNRHRQKLLKSLPFEAGSNYKYSVYTTWEISIEAIERMYSETSHNAVELTRIFCFLHYEGITEDLFEQAWRNGKRKDIPQEVAHMFYMHPQEGGDWNPILFREAAVLLASFSLIKIDELNGCMSMHPLVHVWARDRLSEELQRRSWITASSTLAATMSWEFHMIDYRFRRSLLRHVESCISLCRDVPFLSRLSEPSRVDMAEGFAVVFAENGRLQDAIKLREKVLEARQRTLGSKHPDTLRAMNHLAVSYNDIGRRQEAIELSEKVLEARQRTLGSEHPDTLGAMNHLAVSYNDIGRRQDAMELSEKVLEARQRTLGSEHPDTLGAMNHLAVSYNDIGRRQEAMELSEKVLEARQRTLGSEHPDTLGAMNHLAVSYNDIGRRQEAIELSEKVLEARQRTLGNEHPDTLRTMANLANSYSDLGRGEEAMELREKVLEMSQRTLGSEHPDTLSAITDPANSYSDLELGQEAMELREKVLEARQRTLGIEHPDTLSALINFEKSYSSEPTSALDTANSDGTMPSSKTSFIDTDETNPESSMTHEMTSLSSQRENIIDDKIPRVHGLDNDIQSVVSDEEDIQSQRSSRRLRQEVWAEGHLAIMLAENVELAPLHEDAISKIGADRYIRNLQKFLKRYYLRLSQDAGSNLERATVGLLKSDWSRVRVAQKIVDIKRPKSEDARAQIERDAEEIQGKRPFVEDWISRNAGFASSWTQIQENTVMNTNEATESDKSSEEESSMVPSSMVPSSMVPPNVSDVESFMTEGSAFHNLVTNIRVFLLPPALHPLARTIMSVPSDRLYFSAKDDNSVFNKFKIWIESITEDNWDWWPFRAKMRVLQKGETRLHWHCHCNVHLWVELSELNAERLQWVLERRSVVRNNSHLCGFRRQKQSWRNICHEITCAAGGAFQQSSSSGSSGKALTNPSQNASMGTSGNKAQASKPQMTPQKTATTGQQVTQNNINMPRIQQLLILFGVKGTRRTLELAQIDVENCEDRLLFSKMKDEYRKLRGHLRYLFSFWRLSHCDFVKFEKIRANRVIFRSKEIPTDIIYEYTPRHPHAENPPISPHEFKLAFASCSDRCLFSPFHDCVERSTGKSAIERIPKRKTPLELNKDGVEHAWGLQAQHVISFVHMLFYHLMMLAGSFGFSAWWMGKHPDDLQGAAALPTIFLALLSLFWSSAGVLKLLRDPV